MRTRPKRPYRNLTEYRAKQNWGQTLQQSAWPCLACRGRGRNAAEYKCLACGGTGEGTKTAVVAAYRAEINKYRKEKEDYQALVEAQMTAIAKLTTMELLAIRELGI